MIDIIWMIDVILIDFTLMIGDHLDMRRADSQNARCRVQKQRAQEYQTQHVIVHEHNHRIRLKHLIESC